MLAPSILVNDCMCVCGVCTYVYMCITYNVHTHRNVHFSVLLHLQLLKIACDLNNA